MLWNVWLGMVIVGVILLITSIILTFILKIPELLDELSGRKEKRQVKRLRDLNVGTGSLDGVATEDVYQVMSSGSLLSDEVNIEVINTKIEKEQEIEDEGKDLPTSNLDYEENKTGYVSEGESTSYIDSSDVTNILYDIEKYNITKHTVEIIEEQSSI